MRTPNKFQQTTGVWRLLPENKPYTAASTFCFASQNNGFHFSSLETMCEHLLRDSAEHHSYRVIVEAAGLSATIQPYILVFMTLRCTGPSSPSAWIRNLLWRSLFQLWMLEPDAQQLSVLWNSPSEGKIVADRVAKVLYIPCLNDHSKQWVSELQFIWTSFVCLSLFRLFCFVAGAHENKLCDSRQFFTLRVASAWMKDMSTHNIVFPLSQTRRLLKHLIQSTRRLPQSLRNHDIFYVSSGRCYQFAVYVKVDVWLQFGNIWFLQIGTLPRLQNFADLKNGSGRSWPASLSSIAVTDCAPFQCDTIHRFWTTAPCPVFTFPEPITWSHKGNTNWKLLLTGAICIPATSKWP